MTILIAKRYCGGGGAPYLIFFSKNQAPNGEEGPADNLNGKNFGVSIPLESRAVDFLS